MPPLSYWSHWSLSSLGQLILQVFTSWSWLFCSYYCSFLPVIVLQELGQMITGVFFYLFHLFFQEYNSFLDYWIVGLVSCALCLLHTYDYIIYVSFWILCTSVSIYFYFNYVHLPANFRMLLFLITKEYAIVYIHHIIFIWFSFDSHIDCSQDLAIMNNVTSDYNHR